MTDEKKTRAPRKRDSYRVMAEAAEAKGTYEFIPLSREPKDKLDAIKALREDNKIGEFMIIAVKGTVKVKEETRTKVTIV